MYIPYSRKAKAAISTIAATPAHMGQPNFQPDVRRRDPLTVHQDLPQEVTVISVQVPKEKAAVATAAPGAQVSALTGNLIVPPLHRNAMGFCPFFLFNFPTHPCQPIESSPCPPNA